MVKFARKPVHPKGSKGARIGLLGGTFNPIHIGHLAIAQKALEEFSLDKVIFVPSYLPPHKTIPHLVSARHRYNMVRAAITGHPRFEISDFETRRQGKSYSIDTVKYFRDIYPPPAKIFFITGGDSAAELETWKDVQEILKCVTFIVVDRPGHPKQGGKIPYRRVAMPGIDVSSSYLRREIVQGKDIQYFVPLKVKQYIQKHRLYQSAKA